MAGSARIKKTFEAVKRETISVERKAYRSGRWITIQPGVKKFKALCKLLKQQGVNYTVDETNPEYWIVTWS